MASLRADAYYRENQVTLASSGQLLLMAYDGMLRFLADGRRAMQEQRLDTQSRCLTKTQALLLELMVALDHSVNPPLARNLDRLYRYMYDRLMHANVADDVTALDEVATLLAELRDTWAEADRLTRSQTGAAVPAGVGGYTA